MIDDDLFRWVILLRYTEDHGAQLLDLDTQNHSHIIIERGYFNHLFCSYLFTEETFTFPKSLQEAE